MTSKRTQIFEAVIDYIKTEGVSNLTVSKIARKADIGKGTVYEYFSSKDELISETIIYMLDESLEHIIVQYDVNLPFKDLLYGHIKQLMDNILENTRVNSILMTEDLGGILGKEYKQRIMKQVIATKKKYRSLLSKIIDKGVKEGLVSPVDDEFTIVAISSLIVTSIMYYVHDEHQYEVDDFIDKIYKLIIKMVK